ncbi:hypothetical protein ACU686_40065 [Yinghuangia aomiensis]
MVGIDTAYNILQQMYRQSRDRLHAPRRSSSRWRPRACSAARAAAAFYRYEEPGSSVVSRGRRAAPPRSPGRRARSTRSAWSAPARWPPASSRCSPSPATP